MRIIGHLDMDAFFAAVEERDHPYLQGLPVVVGSDPLGGNGRGVVSTANYAARAYGIRSAMPVSRAWKASEEARRLGLPAAVFLSPSFERYRAVSEQILALIRSFLKETRAPLFSAEPSALEAVSIDECFFDLSFAASFAEAEEIARKIKSAVKRTEKLSASAGIGKNKLIAKIASDFQKPDGLTAVRPEETLSFLAPLAVRRIPGVGPKAEARFARLGVHTVAQARKLTEKKLRDLFGKWGGELFAKLRGEDDSPVVSEPARALSVGEQETLPQDSLDVNVLLPFIEREARDVALRLKADGFVSFRAVALTVRFADFETVSRSRTFAVPVPVVAVENGVGGGEVIRRHVTQMFLPFLDRRENPRRKEIRLVGIRVEKLR